MTQRFVTRIVLGLLVCFIAASLSVADPLNVQFSAEPTNYDPLLMEDGNGLKLAANTIGTPLYYNGRGERLPGLLQSFHSSRDRLRYTLRFKAGLKWSDGKPFHTDHFILALKRLTNEPVKVALSELFPKLDLKRTRATDSRTVELHLKTQDAQMANWLTLAAFAPIRDDMIEAYSKGNPVVPTLGAYMVTEYKREESLMLKKNPNFYDAAQVAIEDVRIRFVGEEGSLYALLKSEMLDILNKVPVLQVKKIAEISNVEDVPVEAVTYLAFNTKKAPFDHKKNRQRFRDSFPYSKKVELANTLNTGEQPASSFLPIILFPAGTNRQMPPVTEPTPNEERLQFQMQSDMSSRNKDILEFVQDEVKDSLKWKGMLNLLDWKAHYSKLKTDPDEVYRFGWQNPVSDPFVTYQVLTSKSPNNFTGWSNSKYDELVEELRREKTNVRRAKIAKELEEILWDEAPVIPLLHQVLKFAYSKRVQGFRANPFGVILFRELRLTQNLKKDE